MNTSHLPNPAPARCERCGTTFSCQATNIAVCQCQSVQVSPAQLQYIRTRYRECLCAACLRALGHEYTYQFLGTGQEQSKINGIS